jgi:hypothetical protein
VPDHAKFVEKREFHIPQETFILLKLNKKDWKKLDSWVKNKDNVVVAPVSRPPEVFLLNETKLVESKRKE